jgi:hypothetical protein
MKRGSVVFVCFCLLFSCVWLPTCPIASAQGFSDVGPDYWAQAAIAALAAKGILNGYPDGSFRPENNITRAEFAKVISLSLGYPPNSVQPLGFSDLAADDWSYGYVGAAVEHGLVKGYPDGSYRPGSNVTKAELLTIIARAADWPPGTGNHFTDVPSSHWAYGGIESCVAHGIVEPGDVNLVEGNTFAPDAFVDRAQTCVFLSRLLLVLSVGQPSSLEREVSPGATDVAINTDLEPHIVINPSPLVAKGLLFVFLPGTGGVPSQYRLILRTGAARGYHAIGLNYPNPTAVGTLCKDSTDPNCFWDVRREIVTGEDTSTKVAVNSANSILHRLQALLSYLQVHYPTEGWERFLSNGSVDWSRVIVAGHSQGGGHAAVMAKLYKLHRAVYFSSPADWSDVADAPPAWLSLPGATDVADQYGFSHLEDTLVPFAHVALIWSALGLGTYGAPASVDNQAAPYGNSHQLTTNAAPNVIAGVLTPAHAATVVDLLTPRTAANTPLYEPVWSYLCFP